MARHFIKFNEGPGSIDKKQMNKPKTIRIIFLILSALMLLFIWGQSLLPQEESAGESGFVTEKIVNPVLRFFGLPEASEGFVRKLAHVTEYAVFAVFVSLSQFGRGKWSKRILTTLSIAFAVAFLDESIQIFTGRGPMIQDVWIDLSGAALGSLAGIIGREKVTNFPSAENPQRE